MQWKDVRAGALSVLDPTGKALPAQADAPPCGTFSQRVDELNQTLEGASENPADSGDSASISEIRDKLSTLRFLAVAGSFASAAMSAVLAAVALAVGTLWPVTIIAGLSAIAMMTIIAFFLALRLSLSYRRKRLLASYRDEVRKLAALQVDRIAADLLVRRSAEDPRLAHAFLVKILTEYEQAADRRGSEPDDPAHASAAARQLMRFAEAGHPVVQTLNLIAADFREKSA